MSTLIMICGPAATGKSTIVEKLLKKYNGFYTRPCDSYFLLGEQRNISKDKVFEEISDEEAGKEYKRICQNHELIICDQHMAIQFQKDSRMAAGDFHNIEDNEVYSESLSSSFMKQILEEDIQIFLICLYAETEVLYKRALSRNKETNQMVRNTSMSMVEKELEKELFFYQKFKDKYNIEGILIDTSFSTKEEVLENVIQEIEQFRRKKKLTFKRT